MRPKKIMGVMGIIRRDDKYLLGLESKKSRFTGEWRLLGGHVEEGEEPKAALHRELKEEAGIQINILRYLELVDGTNPGVRIHVFLAQWTSGNIVPKADEHAEIELFTFEEMLKLNMNELSKEILVRFHNNQNLFT